MSIHLLNKKGWHVWNQENVEKVKRDERLHLEEEKRKNEAAQKAASEHRLSILRKNAISSAAPTVVEEEVGVKRRHEDLNTEHGKMQAYPSDPQHKLKRSLGDTMLEPGKGGDTHKKHSGHKERTFRDIVPKGGPWYSSQPTSNSNEKLSASRRVAAQSSTNVDDPMYNLQARLTKQRELRTQQTTHATVSPLSTSTASSNWTPISTSNFSTVLRDSRSLSYTARPYDTIESSKFNTEAIARQSRQESIEAHNHTLNKHPLQLYSDFPGISKSNIHHRTIKDSTVPSSKVDPSIFEIPDDRTNRYKRNHSDGYDRRRSRRGESNAGGRNSRGFDSAQRQSRFDDSRYSSRGSPRNRDSR